MKQECIQPITTSGFESVANFPHCIGAVDGKHVRVVAPIESGSMHFNYKEYNSIVLMGIADSNYRLIYVNIGNYGKDCDFDFKKNSVMDINRK